jgi:hypothetical protein
MRIKIEMINEAKTPEDEGGVSVEFQSLRGETMVVDKVVTIPEGQSQTLIFGPDQALVLKGHGAALKRPGPATSGLTANHPDANQKPAEVIPNDLKTAPSADKVMNSPVSAGSTGQAPESGASSVPPTPTTVPSTPAVKPPMSAPPMAPMNTMPKVQETGEKDGAGNPIPKVDNFGPTSHAPPPNAPKKPE